MKKVNILVVASKYLPEYSGSGLRAHNTYKRLSRKFPLNFDVLCGSLTFNKIASYEYDGVKVRRVANKLLPVRSRVHPWVKYLLWQKVALRMNYFAEAIPTWSYLRENIGKYDLVHVFGNAAVTSAVITYCNRVKKPLIVEICCEMEKPQHYKPAIIKLFDKGPSGFHLNTQIVCISEKLEAMCRNAGLPHAIWSRPNPVDTNVFFADRRRKFEFRVKNTKFGKEDILLVNISKFMPSKNQLFMIEVLRLLPEKFKLFLGGPLVKEGPNFLRDSGFFRGMQEKVKEYKLSDRVQIKPDFITNMDEHIKMSDVYALPTISEGLGTPMIESICCGVPVVATRINQVTDTWIKEGQNGYLSKLVPKEFAEKVQLATKIEDSKLIRSSQDLSAVADVDRIDAQYYKIISGLIANNTKEKNSVE